MDFFIYADTKEEAIDIAKAGGYSEWDTTCAEVINWDIYLNTGELNE